ncbi:MAG TPA: TetR/AcrR family transcriptional regulator [Dyella sp.]|uniref:TetR/AcrR family transcriptional regulator n=1 Tax=Dyella sp. TaxID=1869338 RepID=UPI002F923896
MFDIETAIEAATVLFWRQGYEGTSLSDLTTAIGIAPPSFYHAFGSKEALFRRVLDRYRASRLQYAEDAVNCATAREVAEQMLLRWAELYTDPECPPGCLAANCALAGGAPDSLLGGELTRVRKARQGRLRKRFKRAQQEGDLAAGANPDALARFLMTVGWGMASDARSGASRADLLCTVEMALKAWPG